MPPLTRNNRDRHLEVMLAKPAARAHAVATGQQGGFSGQIPGTSSSEQQAAVQHSTIQQYPAVTALAAPASAGDSSISVNRSIASGSFVVIDVNGATTTQESNLTTGVSGSGPYTLTLTSPLGYPHAASAQVMGPTTSPNGDQIAGVGHAVLNNAGNPVVVMGNLNAVSGGASSKLPSSFQDGGFSFVDAQGNQVAGYSQGTGLYGFGGVNIASYGDEVNTNWTDVSAGSQGISNLVGGTPNTYYGGWADLTIGQINESGVYIFMVEATAVTVGSATGKYAVLTTSVNTTVPVPLDAFRDTYPNYTGGFSFLVSDVQSFNFNDERYFTPEAALSVPTDATGWQCKLSLLVGRLAY